MKKVMFLMIIVMLVVPFVNADVIPENSHPLSKCVEIINLNEFTDIYFIGYITGPMIQNHETYIIEPDKCLTMGYKYNTLKILAAKKSYLDLVGVDNIDISNENILFSDAQISPYGGYVDEDNHLIKLEIEYSIAGFSDNKLILYKLKETSEYNDGTIKKVETYEKPVIRNLRLTIEDKKIPEPTPEFITEPTPKPQPEPTVEPTLTTEPKGFWDEIACFFKGIFGRNC